MTWPIEHHPQSTYLLITLICLVSISMSKTAASNLIHSYLSPLALPALSHTRTKCSLHSLFGSDPTPLIHQCHPRLSKLYWSVLASLGSLPSFPNVAFHRFFPFPHQSSERFYPCLSHALSEAQKAKKHIAWSTQPARDRGRIGTEIHLAPTLVLLVTVLPGNGLPGQGLPVPSHCKQRIEQDKPKMTTRFIWKVRNEGKTGWVEQTWAKQKGRKVETQN